MTTDFHLLGAADERLVGRAKEIEFAMRCGEERDETDLIYILAELVDRVYRLHEREEELDEERRNADDREVCCRLYRHGDQNASPVEVGQPVQDQCLGHFI